MIPPSAVVAAIRPRRADREDRVGRVVVDRSAMMAVPFVRVSGFVGVGVGVRLERWRIIR
jgi:hypothetical protein